MGLTSNQAIVQFSSKVHLHTYVEDHGSLLNSDAMTDLERAQKKHSPQKILHFDPPGCVLKELWDQSRCIQSNVKPRAHSDISDIYSDLYLWQLGQIVWYVWVRVNSSSTWPLPCLILCTSHDSKMGWHGDMTERQDPASQKKCLCSRSTRKLKLFHHIFPQASSPITKKTLEGVGQFK